MALDANRKQSVLIVIDAKNMKEIARAAQVSILALCIMYYLLILCTGCHLLLVLVSTGYGEIIKCCCWILGDILDGTSVSVFKLIEGCNNESGCDACSKSE